jgi:hypothetical protein
MSTNPKKDNGIEFIGTVQDRGRRGGPLPGCDCVQCFGYCLNDRDKYVRTVNEYGDMAERAANEGVRKMPTAWSSLDDRIDGVSSWTGEFKDSVAVRDLVKADPATIAYDRRLETGYDD